MRHLPSTRPSRVELVLVALVVLAVIIGATWLINGEIGSRIGGTPEAPTVQHL